VERLAEQLGLDRVACAEGIIRVANAEMVRALRVVTVERGIDPRRYALLAFGGAGPLHAAAIAEELGIERIACPRASGVLAALGLVVSPRRRDAQRSVFLAGEDLTAGSVAQTTEELGRQAREALGTPEAELRATYELRYRGQAFELAIAHGLEPTPQELRQAFEAEHEDRYGYRDPDQTLELVTIRITASERPAEIDLKAEQGEEEPPSTRTITLAGSELDAEVRSGALPAGTALSGPAIVELPESTLLIPPGWSGNVDETGTIVLDR
jgi:N-methylhydantoinase A